MDQNNGNETLTNCANNLRRQAEERVVGMCENLQLQLPEEILQLLHKLQIHQIKLEMQNKELRTAMEELYVRRTISPSSACLLYTSDAADE